VSVFVFGGAGFIGRRVVSSFAKAGHETYSIDIALSELGEDVGRNATALAVDLTNFDDVMAAMAAHKPEIVINLAYMRETTPHAAMRVNVLGMDNCFEAARLNGVRHVLFASSIAVNGRQKQYGDREIVESDPTFPTYQYAVHKVFNEWQAKEYREKHGLRITGIRVAHAAAPDKTVGAVDHVQCIVAPARGQSVKLGFRDTKRCVIHVDDVAEIFYQVARKEKPEFDLYNSGGQTLTLGEILDMVRAVVPEADVSFEKETGGDEKSVAYRFDNSRLANEFSIAVPPYEQRVAEMIEAVRGGSVDG